MGKFFLGVIVTLVGLALAGFFYARFGYIDLKADVPPGRIETWLANRAMDASVDRHAPKLENPIKGTEENLTEGMMIYTMNCALCHGSPARKENPLAHAFYPPPPQFTEEAPDLTDRENYWIIKNGVRYTAMPAWEKALSEEQMWKVTTFLSYWNTLPPAVKAKFQAAQ